MLDYQLFDTHVIGRMMLDVWNTIGNSTEVFVTYLSVPL